MLRSLPPGVLFNIGSFLYPRAFSELDYTTTDGDVRIIVYSMKVFSIRSSDGTINTKRLPSRFNVKYKTNGEKKEMNVSSLKEIRNLDLEKISLFKIAAYDLEKRIIFNKKFDCIPVFFTLSRQIFSHEDPRYESLKIKQCKIRTYDGNFRSAFPRNKSTPIIRKTYSHLM